MNAKPVINTIHSKLTTALIGVALLGTTLLAQAGAPTLVSGGVKFDIGYGPNFLSFVAIQQVDGSVKGQAEFAFRADEGSGEVSYMSHFRINCMRLLDDHTVVLGGVVTHDTDPAYIGTTAVFLVRDNGQGATGLPDEAGFPAYSADYGFELDCETVAALVESGDVDIEDSIHPVEAGNLQVNP
jgi:hypothetical protein